MSHPNDADAGAAEGENLNPDAAAAAKPVETPAWAPFEMKDLKLPEGVPADEALLTKFVDYAKTAKLPKDTAQAIVALQAEHLKTAIAAEKAETDKTYAKWDAEVKAIPESDATLASVRKLVDTYGDAEAQKLFKEGDLLRHPGTVRMLAAIAKKLEPDRMPEGSRQSPTDPKVRKTDGERMYGGATLTLEPNPNAKEIK